MSISAYLFEIRQIQGFIFATGKLRDTGGASELIDAICGENAADTDITGLASDLMKAISSRWKIYRSAGGVLDITHTSKQELIQFRAGFRLALAQHAPGLVYNDCIATEENENKARKSARNGISSGGPVRGVSLPLGSPITRPAPRSGGSPAVKPDMTKGGKCKITKEYADLPTLVKRRFLEQNDPRLPIKFTPKESGVLKWPVVFHENEDQGNWDKNIVFPFEKDMIPRIAILHADGNGIGKLYAAVVKNLDSVQVRSLSRALASATQEAVQEAMKPVIAAKNASDVVPARPILLGGDDISIILRADLVTDFAIDFAKAFEDKTTSAVREFIPKHELITTKIGFVVIGPNQPFSQAYKLAESLATAARDENESRISFHRVTGAKIPQEAEELVEQNNGIALWKEWHSLEGIQKLRILARLLNDDDIGRGGLRRVPEILHTNKEEANRIYARTLEMVKQRNTQKYNDLINALSQMGVSEGLADAESWCPLLQAHDLAHFDRRA